MRRVSRIIAVIMSVLYIGGSVTAEERENMKHIIYNVEIAQADSSEVRTYILAEADCKLLAALYNEKNQLMAIKMFSVEADSEMQKLIFTVEEDKRNFNYAKAFLWNMDNISPLSSSCSVSKTSSETWKCCESAYYDDASEEYILTKDYTCWSSGAIWYDKRLYGDFTIELDYYSGSPNRSLGGGDGMAIAFYADNNYSIPTAGELGFTGCGGYGVEIDTWSNSNVGDPQHKHIALIKNDVRNHLVCEELTESKDEKWHHIKITVKDKLCEVYVDDKFKISEKVDCTGYGCLGISAGTGDGVNLHAVKNISVSY